MSVEAPPTLRVVSDTTPGNGTRKYLALGDSYTIGTAIATPDRYPVQTVALLRNRGFIMQDAEIIATNGWTTADLLSATKINPAATNYDAVTLLIGVNDQYQGKSLEEYRVACTRLVQRAVQLANGNADHVCMLSIPDYSVTPFASGHDRQKIASQIDAFNEVNKSIAATFRLHYLNITDDSRQAATDATLVASDGLHFSGKEYAVWAAKLAPVMAAALSK